MEEKTNKKKETVVEIIENGPGHYRNFIFADLKRNTEETADEVRICRCGRSKNMPFCDNATRRRISQTSCNTSLILSAASLNDTAE
jgi:CDGSH-type Zn-finger protein